MTRGEWLWALGLLMVLLVGYGLIPSPRLEEGLDSFNEGAAGKRAFFLLAEKLLPRVSRNTGSIVPADDGADTLVMIGPARYPDRAQWQRLRDWVSEGRALVFAARWQDPAVELGPFGVTIVPRLVDESEQGQRATDAGEPRAEEDGRAPGTSGVATELVSGPVDWRSSGHVRFTDTNAEVALSLHGFPQVVVQNVGSGLLVVCASDYVFTNRSLTLENNAVLAFRILENGAPLGPVYFDETLNEAGTPKIVGILFEHPFRLLTLQILIVTLLFGWMASRRFGPLEASGSSPRRSLVEHAQALGSLHFKVGSGPRILSSYLEFFRRELGLGKQLDGEAVVLPGATKEESGLVQRAVRAAKSPNLEASRVGAMIIALARMRHRKKVSKGA